MYSMSIHVQKNIFYSNEVGGVPMEKPPQIFHCLLK